MRKLIFALAGAATLVACDPTEKHDYGCTVNFQDQDACTQLHITEVEGNGAEYYCAHELGGEWGYHPCAAENRTPGYCQVDEAAGYLPSATPAKVFFYGIGDTVAGDACRAGGGSWHSAN